MNFTKLLNSFFITLIALFFILLGIISVLIPWFPPIRTHIILFVLENTIALSLFGLVSIIVGGAILANVLLSAKHRHYRIRCGTNSVIVDETVIQQYLDRYWRDLFPGSEVPNKVMLKNNRIHVFANFPTLPLSDQKILLQRIEKDLTQAFDQMLGYHKEFYLSASFRENK
jgi:hypothetical protein